MGSEREGLCFCRGHARHAWSTRGGRWRIKVDDGLQGRAIEQMKVGEVARGRLGDGHLGPDRGRRRLRPYMMRLQLRL